MLSRLALTALTLAGAPAWAAPSLSDAFATRGVPFELPIQRAQETPPPEKPEMAVQEQPTGRNFDMELGFRGRYLNVPRAVLDIWFFNADDAGWAYSEDRPGVRAFSGGLEFVVKSKVEADSSGGSNGIFYVEWIDNLMDEGYWDDVEDPPDHLDGDYIVPTSNLGLVTFGANYAYELHMVKTMNTNGNFGMSMLVGGGLGVGVLIGELTYWRPENGETSFVRYDQFQSGNEDGNEPAGAKRVPPVVPIVDINLGFRFNFGDRLVLRIEGGFHDMLYAGGSLGLMF
jgi:hypothetical protein